MEIKKELPKTYDPSQVEDRIYENWVKNEYYVNDFKPYDKAGAYGIQEWIGYIGVEHIEGSYFNVMGFPICHVYERLKKYLKRTEELFILRLALKSFKAELKIYIPAVLL